MPYEVRLTPECLRHLDRLPEKVRAAVLEAIRGPIAENPRRAGKPLRGEFEDLYAARRGDFRVIYSVDESRRLVVIHRAQHRGRVYRHRPLG